MMKKNPKTSISFEGYYTIYIKYIGYIDNNIVWTQVEEYRCEDTQDAYFEFMKNLHTVRDDKIKIHNTRVKMYFSDAEEYRKAKVGEDIRECNEHKRIIFFDEPQF